MGTALILFSFLGGILIGVLIAYLCAPKYHPPQINYSHETEKREAQKNIAEHLKTLVHLQRLNLGGKFPKE